MNQEIHNFISKNPALFWSVNKDKLHNISLEAVLEAVLNNASLKDCLKIIKLIGYKKSLEILQNTPQRKQGNYYPEIFNFFKLYLNSKCIKRY